METCTLSLILFTIFLILYRRIINRTNSNSNFPPGPIRIPIVGLMPFLAINPQKVLILLGKFYGSIYTIFIGNYRVIVLNDYNVIKEAFKEDVFSGRPNLKMLEVRNRGIRTGLVCSEGAEWLEQRKFTIRQLRDFGFGKQTMECLVQEEIDELLDGIRNDAGKPITLQERFNMVVLNALWKITTGKRYTHDDSNLQKLIQNTGADLAETEYTGPLLFLPWLTKYAPQLTRWKQFTESVDSAHAFLQGIINSHKETFDSSNIRDFIDAYLLEIEKTTDPTSSFYGPKGEHFLLIVLLDLFMAGADTQSTTLSWGFLYLTIHQNVQAKIYREIETQIGSAKPCFDDRNRMPYTEATIMEILRKSSLVPMGLFHSTTADTRLKHYDIPKDTVILANLNNALHDPNYWVDPDIFRPERFLNKKNQVIKPDAFLPFSTGKRSCPGEHLARDQLFLIFVNLIQKFEFHQLPNVKLSEKPQVGVVLSPQPYQILAICR